MVSSFFSEKSLVRLNEQKNAWSKDDIMRNGKTKYQKIEWIFRIHELYSSKKFVETVTLIQIFMQNV